MKRILVSKHAGSFAGDKDAAALVRDSLLNPGLKQGGNVIIDFKGVDLATQSFIHALLSNIIRSDPEALGRITFENCNSSVQELIEIVAEYSQEELQPLAGGDGEEVGKR